jgi:acetyltransferase-like isoleucine patch superfamily enzyme
MIHRLLRYLAFRRGRAIGLYKRFNRPNGREWAEFLRRHGGLYHLGENCSILPSTAIIDPPYTSIGDRVCCGACTLICHDGSIEMLEQAYGVKLDRIGKLVIEDDVYIGEGAMIIASSGVTIGKGSIIGAGAVVRENIAAGSVVIGNPAKSIGKVSHIVRFWEADMLNLPWAHIIAGRAGAFDAALEPELKRIRQEYFFGKAH